MLFGVVLFDVSFLLFVDVRPRGPKGNIQRGVVEGAVPGLALLRDSDGTRNLLGFGAFGPFLGAREDVFGVFVAGKPGGTHPVRCFPLRQSRRSTILRGSGRIRDNADLGSKSKQPVLAVPWVARAPLPAAARGIHGRNHDMDRYLRAEMESMHLRGSDGFRPLTEGGGGGEK